MKLTRPAQAGLAFSVGYGIGKLLSLLSLRMAVTLLFAALALIVWQHPSNTERWR